MDRTYTPTLSVFYSDVHEIMSKVTRLILKKGVIYLIPLFLISDSLLLLIDISKMIIKCKKNFPRGAHPYMGYKGMCSPKLQRAVFVRNSVSVLAILSPVGYGFCSLVLK